MLDGLGRLAYKHAGGTRRYDDLFDVTTRRKQTPCRSIGPASVLEGSVRGKLGCIVRFNQYMHAHGHAGLQVALQKESLAIAWLRKRGTTIRTGSEITHPL